MKQRLQYVCTPQGFLFYLEKIKFGKHVLKTDHFLLSSQTPFPHLGGEKEEKEG